MKRSLIIVCLLGFAWLCLPAQGWAASGKEESALSKTAIKKKLRDVRVGTGKLVRGTLDVLTLKKYREKKSKRTSLPEPSKPWLNHVAKKTKKKEEKKSIWTALLPSKKQESKRPMTMKEFVGMDRPQ